MADPLTIVASTVSLIDVCVRVSSYLSSVRKATKTIERDLESLEEAIHAVHGVNSLIRDFQQKTPKCIPTTSLDQLPELDNLWQSMDENARGCTKVLEELEAEVRQIIGKNGQTKPTGKLDGIRKTMRMQSSDPRLQNFHQSLSRFHHGSQICLSALEIFYARKSLFALDNLSNVADKILEQECRLEKQINDFKAEYMATHTNDSLGMIEAASRAIVKPLNKHFMPPRPVSSLFTGRKEFLDELGKSLEGNDTPGSASAQKRFVIQGLGGSGKTEFCCQFAQDNRQKFWAVFSINATSHETAKEGFAVIAAIGGVAQNELAAKAWLASLEQPWLLIIDNADDPGLDIVDFFPAGERGFILVTTRYPHNIKHGTVGRKAFKFEQLESHAATRLLLTAAQLQSPWDTPTMDGAMTISRALGCLPLALIHAGSAIANRLCDIGTYLEYFESIWDAIRHAKKEKRWRRPKHPDNEESSDDETYMNVYSSYELLFASLEEKGRTETQNGSRDAVDLLKIFSFFNRENIKPEVLIAAAQNMLPKSRGRENSQSIPQKLRQSSLWDLLYALMAELVKDRSRPSLPKMLRDVLDEDTSIAEFKTRLRAALLILTQHSLVTYQDASQSYSMHPLVHHWVRVRPQMSLGEQAIWAQAATDVITTAITLPLGEVHSHQVNEFHRGLLLHILNLRHHKTEILSKIRKAQSRTIRFRSVILRFILMSVSDPYRHLEVNCYNQAIAYGKLSYVYSLCQKWDEAVELQEAVKHFLLSALGWEHEASIKICKYLAVTYLLKGSFNKAGSLNERVLQAATSCLGPDHQMTLELLDSLGSTRLLQGRLEEAQELHSQAIEGMRRTLGNDHSQTLSAIDNLGCVYWHKWEFIKAAESHTAALKGLTTQLGETHERTLASKEHLALAYQELGEPYLDKSCEFLTDVLESRIKYMGKENPFTLLTMSNLAYVKHSMGDNGEAERLIRKGLPIAERDLGECHPGVLAAKLRLAIILTAQEKYEEARVIFLFVLNRDKYGQTVRTEGAINGYHKDWIFALYRYVLFWEHQGKFEEALSACEELRTLLRDSKHQIREVVAAKQEELMRKELMESQL